MTSRSCLIALTLVSLIGAGCGGNGNGEPSEGQAPETAITDKDQGIAEAAVLRLSDFPTGWRADASDEEESASDVCANLDFSDFVITGRAESKDFTKGSVTTASSMVAVYEDGAEEVFEQVASDETANCYRDYLEKEAKEDPPEDAEIGEISVGEISFPTVGEKSRAYQIVITVEAEGLSPNLYVDLVFVQKGRSLALVLFLDALTPFDDELKVELAETVASRME